MAAVLEWFRAESWMTPLDLAAPRPPSPGDTAPDRALAAFITQLVAMTTGVAASEIAAMTRRDNRTCTARQMAMYLAHIGCGWPLQRVALAFGRDRSTVSYACHRIEDLRDAPALDALLDACEACVRAAPPPGAAAPGATGLGMAA